MKQELIQEILTTINKEKETVVLVEGTKDKQVLQKFGFTNIITLENKPIYSIVELLDQEVVILTDFDKKGKELYLKLKDLCSRRGVKVKTKLRTLLRKTKVTNIEDLKPHSFI
jgi:5S rRNA maturation endonuclease (ribonuclease M5)